NVQFEVNRVNDVLMVPNAALRWTPRPEMIAPDARDKQGQGGGSADGGASGAPATSAVAPATTPARTGRRRGPIGPPPPVPGQLRRENVWIKDGQYVRSVPVMAGL